MTAVIFTVLITWTIMGVLYFVIDATGSEIAKFILTAPISIILVCAGKIIEIFSDILRAYRDNSRHRLESRRKN